MDYILYYYQTLLNNQSWTPKSPWGLFKSISLKVPLGPLVNLTQLVSNSLLNYKSNETFNYCFSFLIFASCRLINSHDLMPGSASI